MTNQNQEALLELENRRLRRKIDSQQAKIDALMLEYCPDEMTKDQIDNWAEAQQLAMQDFYDENKTVQTE
jgi:hypothetical protein